jgi:hypothetical protein
LSNPLRNGATPVQYINDNWPAFAALGGLFAAIWALSLASLKSIRDSEHADEPTKDAAAAAMIGLVIVISMGSAAGLGYTFAQHAWGALLGAFIFAAPFIAMWVVYVRRKRAEKKKQPAA